MNGSMMNEAMKAEGQRPAALWKRLTPLAVFAAAIGAYFGFGLDQYVTFEALREHRGELMAFVGSMPVSGIVLFIAFYAVATALSLPGAALLTVTGGFLFGVWVGTIAVVFGATLGATGVFLIAKTALGDSLRQRAGPAIRKMEEGFKQNALSYLLVLRLIPLFPFFLVNLVPAFLGVPLVTFVIGTFFGIMPGTFVFTSIGAGLGSIFDSMQEFTLKGALTPEVIVALAGLAVLSLIPVAYRAVKARKTAVKQTN